MDVATCTTTVLGAGSWGTALCLLLARNKHKVKLWAHNPNHVAEMQQTRCNIRYMPSHQFPEHVELHHNIQNALADADNIIIAVPSQAFRITIEMVAPYLTNSPNLMWATKGLEPNTGYLLDQVVRDVLGKKVTPAVISGPSFAKEVADQKPTTLTLACENEEKSHYLCELLSDNAFRVYHNDDMIGVQLGGAIKNVLAIGTGIAQGLDFGANARAALITRGLVEMIRLGEAIGSRRDTLTGLSGLGDLVLTCSDLQSRNLRFGNLIGRGKSSDVALHTIGQVVEGIGTTAEVHRLSQEYKVEMPICEQVYEVLFHGKDPMHASHTLMARALKPEY